MNPTEADQHIILSRQTLSRYVQMAAAGQLPYADGKLFNNEIALLELLAEQHPEKAQKLANLVSEWVAFREGLRAKLH
jgi:hypothetical protein